MPARTVIESYCERCGTRYTFEPPKQRGRRLVDLGKTLGLVDTEGEPEAASQIASRDPFHGTFHFCLECRQYTCSGCWNPEAGFCQGCAPLPEGPDLVAAEAAATDEASTHVRDALEEIRLMGGAGAWPRMDLPENEEPELPEEAESPEPSEWITWAPAADQVALPEPIQPPVVLAGADSEPDAQVAAAAELHDEAPAADEPFEFTVESIAARLHTPAPSREKPLHARPAATARIEPVPGPFTWIEPDTSVETEPVEPTPTIAAAGPTPATQPVAPAEARPAPIETARPTPVIAPLDAVEPRPAVEAVAPPAPVSTTTPVETPPAVTAEPASPPVVKPAVVVDTEWEALVRTAPQPGGEPATHDPAPVDWAALSGSLGPDVDAKGAPVAPPTATPRPSVPPPPPSAPRPQPAAPAPSALALPAGWSITAPDNAAQAWPPLAPAHQPRSGNRRATGNGMAHPAILSAAAGGNGAPGLAAGQAHGSAAATHLPTGVRPCHNCELPLSAQARFCRRCGQSQV